MRPSVHLFSIFGSAVRSILIKLYSTRIRSREATPVTSSRHRSSTSQHPRADQRRHPALGRESSRDSVPRRVPSPRRRQSSRDSVSRRSDHRERENSGSRRQSSLTRRDDCRQTSPKRRSDSRHSSPRERSISRRVKLQHRIVDENNKTPQYKEVFAAIFTPSPSFSQPIFSSASGPYPTLF